MGGGLESPLVYMPVCEVGHVLLQRVASLPTNLWWVAGGLCWLIRPWRWMLGKTNGWVPWQLLVKSRYPSYLVEPTPHTFWGLERPQKTHSAVQHSPCQAVMFLKLWASLTSISAYLCRKQQQKQLPAAMLLASGCQGPKSVMAEVGYGFGRWYCALQLLPVSYPQGSGPLEI